MKNRFIVPQFIDKEDKIWGPITVRQFVLVIVGAFFVFLAYKLADFALFIFETVIITIFTALFAFYKVNGAPFHIFALNFIETFRKPPIRVWQMEYIKTEEHKLKGEEKKEEVIHAKAPVPSKRLAELSLIIDTGGAYRGEKEANEINNLSYDIK
ncbi:PrgI family protein [Candidatus Parcubacteria bacterium]|nr:MAG: PrgI family protein [Candidatus Parcubacteria bacterium]